MQKITVNKTVLAFLVLIFVFGMLVCSAFTSPLYPNYCGGDSALFILIGKGITEGKIVYKDLFDHKGPILFFIEAFGYFIGKSTGIFILQCIFGIINLSLLYSVWNKIRQQQNNKSLIDLITVFIAGCAVFFYTFQSGNLSEEYSLPLISTCILLFVKYAQHCENDAKHPYWYSFVYGVVIMLLALIRINNAITVLSGVFAIILYLILKKEYKNILINLLFGILGLCAAALPVIIYFASISALYDMIYATFIYNFKYAVNISHQSILAHLPKYAMLYLPMLCSGVLILLKIIKEKKISFFDFLAITIVALNTICLIISNIYPHYFTIYIPVFVLVLSAYFTFERKALKNLLIALCVVVYILNVGYNLAYVVYTNYVLALPKETHNNITKIVEQIPQNERDAVIGYRIPCSYYLRANIVPCFKYYTQQEWWSKSNPAIMTSFVEYINSGKALWLLTLPDEDNADILKIISEKYDLVDESKYFNMYKIKEER